MKEAEIVNNIMNTIRPIIKENEELKKENKQQESEIKDYRERLGLRA